MRNSRQPDQQLVTPEQYNQLFSMHGITMIFLYAMPVLSGFSNYLWPLLFGARDMAFPRLNAASYWMYLAAGLFMYAGFAGGQGANDGWFNYVPNASRDFNPGLNMDFYALGLFSWAFRPRSERSISWSRSCACARPECPSTAMPLLLWGYARRLSAADRVLVVPSVERSRWV